MVSRYKFSLTTYKIIFAFAYLDYMIICNVDCSKDDAFVRSMKDHFATK